MSGLGTGVGMGLLQWLSFGVHFVVALAVIAVAMSVVLRVQRTGALLLAGAAAVHLFGLLAWRVSMSVASTFGLGSFETIFFLMSLLQIGLSIATGALLIFALVTLARAFRAAPGQQLQPPRF